MPSVTAKIGSKEFLKRPRIAVPAFAVVFLAAADRLGFCAEQSWGGYQWDVGTVNLFHPDWPDIVSPQLIAAWVVRHEHEWTFNRCTYYANATNERVIVHTMDEAVDLLETFIANHEGQVKPWISPRSSETS